MTAILISRAKFGKLDYLYATVDRRVTAGDTIVSDDHKKIRTFEPTEHRPHKRHILFCGDAAPVDYMAARVNMLVSEEDIFQYVMESEIFQKMPNHNALYIIDETVPVPEITVIDKNKKRTGVSKVVLDELLMNPIFDGSGGEAVLSAHNALVFVSSNSKVAQTPKQNIERYESSLEVAFEIGSQIVSSMNNRIDILKIRIGKL